MLKASTRFLQCIVCEESFRHGPGAYGGRYVARWNAYVCHECIGRHRDGVCEAPGLAQRLRDRGASPEINDNGWIVIPGR